MKASRITDAQKAFIIRQGDRDRHLLPLRASAALLECIGATSRDLASSGSFALID
jgi:hypothetical protein